MWPVPSSAAVRSAWSPFPTSRKQPCTGSSIVTSKTKPEAIYTDELKSYLGIAARNTRHQTVRHSIEEWVVGDVHTNSVEGVWSLFKRSIAGAFHKISKKHLDRYLEELEWRVQQPGQPLHLPGCPAADRPREDHDLPESDRQGRREGQGCRVRS